jgi:hypothetical protein
MPTEAQAPVLYRAPVVSDCCGDISLIDQDSARSCAQEIPGQARFIAQSIHGHPAGLAWVTKQPRNIIDLV